MCIFLAEYLLHGKNTNQSAITSSYELIMKRISNSHYAQILWYNWKYFVCCWQIEAAGDEQEQGDYRVKS